jgi:hypothetical protein
VTSACTASFGARVRQIGVYFQPGRAREFLRAPVSEFTDGVLPLDSVWNERCEERIESASEQRQVEILEEVLLRRRATVVPYLAAQAAAAMTVSNGDASVEDWASLAAILFT